VDARAFLLAVVPWIEGYATIHRHRAKKKFFGRSCRTIEDALGVVDEFKRLHEDNIYFCLSRQERNGGQRSREHATALYCVWFDVDIDPNDPTKYSTLAEAVASVLYFCQLVGIPEPSIIVITGGGIHCYWLSDRVLTVEEWQPYADALKNAARHARLKIDAGITGDAARVLRVPDTLNYKYTPPRPVRLLQSRCNGVRHDFSRIFAPLFKIAPADGKSGKSGKSEKVGNLGPVPKAFAHLRLVKLGAGVEDYPPLPLAPIKAGCPWIREAHDTGGKELTGNMLWNLLVLSATFMEDGNEIAHQFSNQHSSYSFQSTEAKWASKIRERGTKDIGWPSCRVVQDAGSRHCATCVHFHLGKSPLHLGLPTAAAASDEEIEELGGKRSDELPQGFCHNDAGKVCAIVPGKATRGGGVTPTRIVQLTTATIKDPSLQYQEGQFGLAFTASTDLGGWHEVFVPSSHMRGEKLLSHLASAFVLVLNSNKETDALMGKFMNSWMDKLREEQKALRGAGTLGWRYEDGKKIGFVYGGFLHHIDGSQTPVINTTDDEFRRHYMPVGSKEPWLAAAKLLTDRKRPELDILLSVAFASPLMVFTGNVYGTVISNWGEPGTAKSTAQQVAAAVYGNPKQTRESLNSTAKSVMGRLGRTKNLPAYWDDIQDEKHQEALFQSMFVASEGTEGGRLNTDASMKERKDWQTLMVACSNASFVEFLIKKQKSTTAGMRRVFEYRYDKHPDEPGMVDALDAQKTFAALEHNYGMVGMEYARLLTTEHKAIEQKLDQVTRAFKESVNGRGDENFWWGLCGVLITGGWLANRLGAEIDVPAMAGFLAVAYRNNRRIRSGEGTEGGSWNNTEQSLVAFLNYYVGSGNVIYTDITFRHKDYPVNILRYPEKMHPIYVQIMRDERKIAVSKRKFREYMQTNNIQARQVLDGLTKFFNATESRLTLAAGTGFSMAQETVLEIVVPEGRHLLEHMLVAFGPPAP
jgi:hypothetical protein